MGKYQKNIEAARRISVVQYLETYHPGELVRKTDKEYRTKTHSSLVITPANGMFHWYAQSVGGNNAIDYLTNAGVAAGQTGVAGRVHTDFERKQCGHAGRTGGISEPLHSHGEEAECFRRCSGSHVPGAYHILL